MVDLPILDPSLCTACGICVEICPPQCLELTSNLAWLPRPGDCISCGACVAGCPTGAISMED